MHDTWPLSKGHVGFVAGLEHTSACVNRCILISYPKRQQSQTTLASISRTWAFHRTKPCMSSGQSLRRFHDAWQDEVGNCRRVLCWACSPRASPPARQGRSCSTFGFILRVDMANGIRHANVDARRRPKAPHIKQMRGTWAKVNQAVSRSRCTRCSTFGALGCW